MTLMGPYRSRTSAIAAARRECRLVLGPYYEAAEPYDYEIHPLRKAPPEHWKPYKGGRSIDLGDRWGFKIVGPAANPSDEEKEAAKRAWRDTSRSIRP